MDNFEEVMNAEEEFNDIDKLKMDLKDAKETIEEYKKIISELNQELNDLRVLIVDKDKQLFNISRKLIKR